VRAMWPSIVSVIPATTNVTSASAARLYTTQITRTGTRRMRAIVSQFARPIGRPGEAATGGPGRPGPPARAQWSRRLGRQGHVIERPDAGEGDADGLGSL